MKKVILVSLLAGVCCFAASAATVAAEEMKLELKPGMTMKEVLSENIGKRIALRLEAGDEIEGTVISVGNSLAHISKLTGKDFFDAAVNLDKISAVRMKVRDK